MNPAEAARQFYETAMSIWGQAPEFRGWTLRLPLSAHFDELRMYYPILARKRNAAVFMPLFEPLADEAQRLYEAGEVEAGRAKMGELIDLVYWHLNVPSKRQIAESLAKQRLKGLG